MTTYNLSERQLQTLEDKLEGLGATDTRRLAKKLRNEDPVAFGCLFQAIWDEYEVYKYEDPQ